MIAIVTTYKNRSNYTTITYTTLRESISQFCNDTGEEVALFFYDDASNERVPSVVKSIGRVKGVAGIRFHRNEKSLGAEYGNIDAITKCFEAWPEATHVFVLDNDLCVHPYALHAISRMIKDIPNLGCGSIFNSNVFPEREIVKDSYVVKDVNPGLGAVIQREAWFWHLEKSKGTKLDKNPKQPGWDWNLSAWMKDSGDKWNVYSTYQSYVEHIGAIGTNVNDSFMTRARRFYDKTFLSLESNKIDIVMPIKDLTPAALGRMRYCLSSLSKNGDTFRLCISDSSKESMEVPIRKMVSELGISNISFYWEKNDGLFNRSRTINNGVRYLVESDPFIIMDTDVIVPSNFLEKFIRLFDENGNYVLGRLAYLCEGSPLSDDWGAFTSVPVNFYYNSGFLITSLGLFKRVNGFDEDYVGWGAEDDQLNVRMNVATGGKIRKLVGMEMTCWHLYHQRKDVIESDACEANRKRYWGQKELFETGKLPVYFVNGLVTRDSSRGIDERDKLGEIKG